MMPTAWAVATMFIAAVGSLIFSTLTYSLRDLSRARLSDYLQRHHHPDLIDPIVEHLNELIFVTATVRVLANTLIALASVWLCQPLIHDMAVRDLTIFFIACAVTLVFSVALPQAITRYAGDVVVGASARPLHVMRMIFKPLAWVMHLSDRFVRNASGAGAVEPGQLEQQIEDEILSAVEEGAEQGVVDEQEREMIESVIEFHDSTAGQIMTARTDIAALDIKSNLQQVKQVIETSGHSRIPVHEGTLDQIVGILYARDLLKHLGQPPEHFDIRSAMRPALFVPETTPLADLLYDFRKRKIHIAVVLDEYGGTTGLVTIEDILKALVGEISDEHEPVEPRMFKRSDDHTIEADARIDIEELNRLTVLNLPEDAGYATLGGFVLATLGRIPEPGFTFEQNGVKYTVLEAEPQRVKRIRIEQVPAPVESEVSAKQG
ncbi:MAG TPA: hemolysin family protein [Tepidisphaeraceae bacterium]|jgi:putative hemolysin